MGGKARGRKTGSSGQDHTSGSNRDPKWEGFGKDNSGLDRLISFDDERDVLS